MTLAATRSGSARAGSKVPGPVLFARYAFGPNRLGYCGTPDHAAVLAHGSAGEERPLRELARTFDGAYPYLELIAAANSVEDPLDARVVEAYWLGNELTGAVEAAPMQRSLVDRFRSRVTPSTWRWLEATVPAGARPVHAFHVMDVFPRVGLLRGDQADDVLRVVDSCRIRWGRVRAVQDGTLVVASPRLTMVEGQLVIGPAEREVVDRWIDGVGFVTDVEPGDAVSIHWGWACDRLSRRQLANLERWTAYELAVANRAI
jgi:hypothetical protein